MPLVLSDSKTYFWKIELEVPTDDGFKEVEFEVKFKSIPQSKLLKLVAKQQKGEINDVDIVKEILVGWRGITDDDGKEVPYTLKARDQLLDVVGIASAIGEVFFESRVRAKRKN